MSILSMAITHSIKSKTLVFLLKYSVLVDFVGHIYSPSSLTILRGWNTKLTKFYGDLIKLFDQIFCETIRNISWSIIEGGGFLKVLGILFTHGVEKRRSKFF